MKGEKWSDFPIGANGVITLAQRDRGRRQMPSNTTALPFAQAALIVFHHFHLEGLRYWCLISAAARMNGIKHHTYPNGYRRPYSRV